VHIHTSPQHVELRVGTTGAYQRLNLAKSNRSTPLSEARFRVLR
jgi:hypothetical protein